ncbi:Mrp/NBP35 family ATP-binding protein [Cohnella lubricantis]|uniref:Iron-sulfur cluster carrier protein n=1 Tax=Cohnella lubricantis TaxID=2163172 RepID=A0A841TCK5_9BACL|nr:Mrp/NBP35 family ATP-binding protein [Cohnella lubricantis]MBB6679203.1 Mrp/NBP35 family ATP-binding protein [Cohnella lubricantis]MBP2119533.1 ATP-binding protein involved in chromosome partitioning [Cohnella lubricantis]
MITRENVLDALQSVNEPTLDQPLVSLGLVRDVVVRENGISLTAVLHPDSITQADKLEEQLHQALAKLHTSAPHIRVRPMTEHEKADTLSKLGHSQEKQASQQQQQQQAPPVKGHGAGLENSPLLAPGSETQFIAVASGKGGVGKSTVTVNLAVALARCGKRVGLMDCDIYGFSVPDMMGIEERPVQVGNKINPVERFGVKVISMGFFVEDNSPVVWRGPMLGRMLRNFFQEINWGELDYVLLDLPPGTGDVALDVHQILPQSKEIIVTTPHATAAFVAARAGAMAIKTQHEVLGVVENMSWYESRSTGEREYVFGRGGGGRLAETLHTELLAQFPLGAPDNHPAEPDFSPSVYKADSPTGQEYTALARKIIERCNS